MYTVSEDRPRGTSAGQSSREFPVLFHLMDVSRPRASQQTPKIDSANLLNAVEQLRWPPDDDEPSPPASVESENATSESSATSNESPPTTETVTTAPATTVTTPELADSANDNIALEPLAAENSQAEEATTIVEPPSPPPSSPLVTLRKKHKTSASEDWFASHGKYIAVVFVLALVATIYFARVNRERSSVAKQETPSQPPLIDSRVVATTSEPASSSAPSAPTVQTASAAAPAGPSPVELRAPQFVAEPLPDRPKDNLFEFTAAKNGDDRIAARADDVSKTAAPPNAAPLLTAPALAGPSQPTAPEVIATPAPQSAPLGAASEATAYPATSSPATHYPVSIPPAAAYPTTSSPQPASPGFGPPGGNSYQPQPQYAPATSPAIPPIDYRSQYPVTPASLPPQQPAAQAWNAGQPASYPSYDTTARGPRNERTGSGTY